MERKREREKIECKSDRMDQENRRHDAKIKKNCTKIKGKNKKASIDSKLKK